MPPVIREPLPLIRGNRSTYREISLQAGPNDPKRGVCASLTANVYCPSLNSRSSIVIDPQMPLLRSLPARDDLAEIIEIG